MKAHERIQCQEIIRKIEEDNFSSSDIDLLFIKLREHPYGNQVFLEIANFVAHGDVRDKGLIFDNVRSTWLNMTFYVVYGMSSKQFNIDDSFHEWEKDFLKYLIQKEKTIMQDARLPIYSKISYTIMTRMIYIRSEKTILGISS